MSFSGIYNGINLENSKSQKTRHYFRILDNKKVRDELIYIIVNLW